MKKIEQLQEENAALAAQVEALRDLLDNVRRSEEFMVDHAIMLGVDCDLADEIDAALAATPQHHLRELRAEAGRAGYLKGADDWKPFDQCFDSDIQNCANQYAEQIRQGEVE